MKLADLKTSGHAPSLLSAFLHFDISFMVWVILGALMPFIATDPALTGANLNITPSALISKATPYTLIIKGPDAAKHEAATVTHLLLKPGLPKTATRNSVAPAEKYVLDSTSPATIAASLAAVNAHSHLIQVASAPSAHGVPNENVLALKPRAVLAQSGKTAQPLANGYPAGVKLFLVGLPLLAAGFWRLFLGALVDRFASKRVGVVSMAVTLLPLLVGWKLGTSYDSLVFIAFFLGLAGASFAVSLPLASRWYPPHLQGVAMGIAGAGNSGTILATIFAPLLVPYVGWHGVFGLLMIPVALTLIAFAALAKDAPGHVPAANLSAYTSVLKTGDAWVFCLLYFVTFGGFVGMSSFINTFFVDQYDYPKVAVGLATWPFIISGSLLRPVGGALADRLGGIRMLGVLYGVAVVAAIAISFTIANQWVTFPLLFVLMGAMGMGNGSVFQIIPQRFRGQIGVMTGLVGAAGGVGGYYLNVAMGRLHDITHSYGSGFFAYAAMAAVALLVLRVVSPAWQKSWVGAGGVASSAAPLREPALVGHAPELEPV